MAERNTGRLLSLVDQLLELSKIDSGNRKIQLEKGKATHLIAAWAESFSYLAKQKNIDFEIQIENKDREVWFDADALEKITVNLLGNAVKYTPENGGVRIFAKIISGILDFKIENTGEGLTKDQIKTLFDRFYQTDEQNDGTGIGLSLVKELAELHKGAVTVTSNKNQNTIFSVQLCIDKNKFKNVIFKKDSAYTEKVLQPVINDSFSEVEPTIDENLPILLIVEDNVDVRNLLADTFRKAYQIISASNGEEGVVKAIEKIPDLIISDIMMPIKDGIQLTKQLKEDERTSHIPIILLTAKAGDENELSGIEVGADDYITKPFNQKILKSKVTSLIDLRRELRSRYSQEVILKPRDIAITSTDERFLEKLQSVLDEKLIDPSFSVENFSAAVHMSRMQLHRKLKALTGLSTSEFIRSQRLKLAAQILKKSDVSISEVGYSVGFNDHAYFSKCFKETYNCTPSDFAMNK
ncbi:hybrid sensor histidine kinase/response regulator transcription factor [Maribacter halichondriae]|uniref:hybrid sensor histidine kinase/response regulator transcription factor n=1 Tax=Maribacter halichondriae TaxID=2980554 RepID=UPI002358DDCC|nr:response regulator [Maribacter sp. Hal144]